MGHTLTTLLVFAKDEARAYRLANDVYRRFCKNHQLWHYHLMGTKRDNEGDRMFDEYPKAILFDSKEGGKIIRDQLSGLKQNFLKSAEGLKQLLKQTDPNMLWVKGGKDIDIHCERCHTNHKEYKNIFSLCQSIAPGKEFVDEIYVWGWDKITNGYEWKSFLEEYNAAQNGEPTEYNKEIIKAICEGKKLWIIPAYTKT